MANNRPYFTLLEFSTDPNGSGWAIQFGDYDKKTVQYEMEEMKDKAKLYQSGFKYQIIRTENSLQDTINKAVSELNAKLTGPKIGYYFEPGFSNVLSGKCTYPDCKCIVSTSTSQPKPVCPSFDE